MICSVQLQKKDDELKGSEEKVKQLKRGNADLAAVAVKLDEKLKQRRQDSLNRKCRTINTSSADSTEMVTKDQLVKIAADKDHIIESLREKCQEFSRIFTSRQNVHLQIADNLHIYTDISQLKAVLQQAAKEQLQLEKRLAANELMDDAVEAQLNSVKSLEISNSRLEAQLSQLTDELQDKEKLEVEVMEWRIEVDVLKKDMDVIQQRCHQLEKEIGEILLKNTELNVTNSDLQKQLDELGKYVKKLTEQNKQIEAENQWCVEQLELKQLECDSLIQAKEADRANVSHLEDRVTTLQQQCLDLKTDRLQMLMEFDQMKQHYEQRLLIYRRSSVHNATDANCNTNNHASGLPSNASDCFQFWQSANSANVCDIIDHDQTGGSVDVTQCKPSIGTSTLFSKERSFRVFIVLYDYDPYQSSPNDQPDIELPLSEGEHVFIMGDVDEDGFYNGTLTDGRCGLVPSNFVRELYDEEGQKMEEMETLQMSERLWQMDAARQVQGIDGNDQLLCGTGTDDNLHSSCPLICQQDISSDVSTRHGDQLRLEDSDSCHVGAPQFVSMPTLTVCGQPSDVSRPVCLTPQLSSQLHSTHMQSSIVQSDAVLRDVTVPSVNNMMSRHSPAFSSCDYTLPSNRDNVARHRPLSEPCAVTGLSPKVQTLSSGSVELMKQTNTNGYAQHTDICAVVLPSNQSHNMEGCDETVYVTDTVSSLHAASSSHPMQVSDVPRPSALLPKESCVNSVSGVISVVGIDERCKSNHAPTGESELNVSSSVWRKVEPRRVSEQGNIKSVLSSEPTVNVAGISNAIGLSSQDGVGRNVAGDDVCVARMQPTVEHGEHSVWSVVNASDSNDVDGVVVVSHGDDKDACRLQLPSDFETKVDAEDTDSSHCETDYDLTDNNVVTTHQLRDNIPDSELIDYSEDGGESLIDSISCTNDKEQVRIFVALFDYDPATMSPNPDAVESELPFTEGQLIKVFGEPDGDGFYYGECNGQRGLVPSNIVAVVEVDDAEAAMQLLRDTCQSAARDSSVTSSRGSSQTSSYLGRQQVNGAFETSFTLLDDHPVRYMVAMYSYDPIELSPNIDADQELAFSRGDIIAVYGDADDDGFYFGELDGRSGLVPSNFLKEAPLGFSVS